MKDNIVKSCTLFYPAWIQKCDHGRSRRYASDFSKTLYAHFENKEQLVRESSFLFLTVSGQIELIKTK